MNRKSGSLKITSREVLSATKSLSFNLGTQIQGRQKAT